MAKAKDSIGPGFIDLNRLMPQSILERDRAARDQWGDEDPREQILHRSTISANWAMSFESNLLISQASCTGCMAAVISMISSCSRAVHMQAITHDSFKAVVHHRFSQPFLEYTIINGSNGAEYW